MAFLGFEHPGNHIFTIVPWQREALIILFVELLKFSNNNFFKEQNFVKQNRESIKTLKMFFLKHENFKISKFFKRHMMKLLLHYIRYVLNFSQTYQTLLHIYLFVHSRWLKTKIQTTKSSNFIGHNIFFFTPTHKPT